MALLSYYFGGKEKVFYALYDTFFPGNRLGEFGEILKDPVEGLRVLVLEVLRFRDSDPELAAITVREIIAQSSRGDQLKNYTVPVWRKLREVLENGRSQGIYHYRSLDLAMRFVMGAILFPVDSAVTRELETEERLPTEAKAEELGRLIFNAFGAGEHWNPAR